MTERSQEFMRLVWEARNAGADTEEQLVSEILKLVSSNIKFYTAQNDIIVLDQIDLMQLATEISELTS